MSSSGDTGANKNKGVDTEFVASESTNEASNSIRLQSSNSSESDLSFSLLIDRELENFHMRTIDDELPAFEIRLISPLGRTPSPIDVTCLEEDTRTPTRNLFDSEDWTHSPYENTDFVALQEINAQISPPENVEGITGASSLETIFEGVFLNTPPRQRSSLRHNGHIRNNLFEKMVMERLNVDKENHSPQVRPSASPHTLNNNSPKVNSNPGKHAQ